MVFWEGSWCKGRLTKKGLKRHMVFWEGSWCEGRRREKMKRHMVFVGRFWVGRLLYKTTWNATWFSGKVLGGKVFAKKLETPHDFLRKVWVWRLHDSPKKFETPKLFAGKVLRAKVASQKNLTMVFWEGSGVRSSTQKKTWKAAWFSGKVLGVKGGPSGYEAQLTKMIKNATLFSSVVCLSSHSGLDGLGF